MKLSKDDIRVLKDIRRTTNKDPKFWHSEADYGIIDALIDRGFASEKIELATNKYWVGILKLTRKGLKALKK
jgi:hypothetical protein